MCRDHRRPLIPVTAVRWRVPPPTFALSLTRRTDLLPVAATVRASGVCGRRVKIRRCRNDGRRTRLMALGINSGARQGEVSNGATS